MSSISPITNTQEAEDCPICYEPLQQIANLVNQFAICGHRFHKDCIAPWIKNHNTCPYCRRVVVFSAPMQPRRPVSILEVAETAFYGLY